MPLRDDFSDARCLSVLGARGALMRQRSVVAAAILAIAQRTLC